MKNTLILILVSIGFILKGQNSLLVEGIDAEIEHIENNNSLKEWGNEWYNVENKDDTIVYWGFLDIWYENNQIFKIVQLNNWSYGNEKIIIYLKNEKPIKIIELENNTIKDKLKEVFKASLYTENWDENKFIIQEDGKRVHSEKNYSTVKYNSILNSAKSVLREAISQEEMIKRLK